MTATPPALRWRGRPERVFVSVDSSTKRSTISFQPTDACDPFQCEDDGTGITAMREATAIAATFAGCTVHGPFFHDARPTGRVKFRRKPAPRGG
jgi:hypothetical protein